METKVARRLIELFRKEASHYVRRAERGDVPRNRRFVEVLNWYKSESPWILVTPDVILVFDDYSGQPADILIVAVELKFFSSERQVAKRRFRQAFREIGQPLRNLIFGFNAVVLWHIFEEHISDDTAKRFGNICREVISELKLPMVYFATRMRDNAFKLYQPWEFGDYNDINYIASSLRNLVGECRNPALETPSVAQRREAVKMALNIP